MLSMQVHKKNESGGNKRGGKMNKTNVTFLYVKSWVEKNNWVNMKGTHDFYFYFATKQTHSRRSQQWLKCIWFLFYYFAVSVAAISDCFFVHVFAVRAHTNTLAHANRRVKEDPIMPEVTFCFWRPSNDFLFCSSFVRSLF